MVCEFRLPCSYDDNMASYGSRRIAQCRLAINIIIFLRGILFLKHLEYCNALQVHHLILALFKTAESQNKNSLNVLQKQRMYLAYNISE